VRWGSPVQHLYRTTVADYTVGSTTIPAGSRVLLLFGAANRDPRKFPDPDVFDIDRNPTDHVGFGSGIHHCLGAKLARLEARVVLEELLPRVRRIRALDPITWRDNPTVHGPEHLFLQLEP
jgi:beta-dihydromenaquinone-9 omega-hydroxylase